uniref:Uncharacterized protein n=1 Tax=Hyaloperonospora arabidopsidis (strain Emoy2) TaxID=559515 RepID=M4BR98_HYAAE
MSGLNPAFLRDEWWYNLKVTTLATLLRIAILSVSSHKFYGFTAFDRIFPDTDCHGHPTPK